jgi:hypothetical protein
MAPLSLRSPTPQPLGCRAVGMPCHVGPLCFGATGASCPSQGSPGMLAFAQHAGGCKLHAACLSIGVCSYSLGTLSSDCITAACPLQSGRVLYYDLHAATAECVSAFETGSGNRRTTKVQSVNRARRGLRRRESNAAQRAGSRLRTQWLHDRLQDQSPNGSRSAGSAAVLTIAALQSIPATDSSAAACCLSAARCLSHGCAVRCIACCLVACCIAALLHAAFAVSLHTW